MSEFFVPVMAPTTIYHITERASWEAALAEGWYRCPSLEQEGFIHCSRAQQVLGTAELYYSGQSGLVLLCIEVSRLSSELRMELSRAGERFPHLYGALETTAVTRVCALEIEAQSGAFVLPEGVDLRSPRDNH